MKRCTLLLIILSLAGRLYAQEQADGFSFAAILQDSMVIQQGKPFTVWGTAARDGKVTVTVGWNRKTYTAHVKNGQWQVKVDVPAAKKGDFTAHAITASAGGRSATLKGLLIGEVWICSGQSNMSMYMKPFMPWHNGAENHEQEIAAADYPFIRFITLEKDTASRPKEDCKGRWGACYPATAATFSAIGYYFSRELFHTLNVPIGIVVSAYGGAACQAFTAREVLAGDQELNTLYLAPYDRNPTEKSVTGRPTLIYNAMIHPLRKLSVSGFVWNQGESNAGIRKRYPRLCAAMIRGWRSDFNQGDLPFYFVQVPPYNFKKHDPYEFGFAMFREEQAAVLAVKNTGMVCTMDVGDTTTVHGSKKKQIGERMGWLALHKTYGFTAIQYEGPKYAGMKVAGDSVFVSYTPESLSGGLMLQHGPAPLHFFLAGADRRYYPAAAVIVGNEVHLHSKRVQKPVAIRYGFTNYPYTNLANNRGIPAYQFRTDQWDDAKMLPAD